MKLVILFGALAFLLSALTGLLLIRLVGRLKAPTEPHRWAKQNKPLVGGMAMCLTFLTALAAYALLDLPGKHELTPFAVCGVLGFLLGLADDVYRLKPAAKLSGQIACGLALVACGVEISFFDYAPANLLLTLFWVVGLMNSVNMLDNMDGVTGGVALGVLVLSAVFLALHPGGGALLPLTAALIGAVAGFLWHNWKPARMFMGDAGSQFLGVILAAYGVRLFWNLPQWEPDAATWAQFATPVLMLLPPILDTTFVTVARLARGQSPAVGGRDHTTHHLSYLGVPGRVIPLLYLSLALASGAVGLWGVWWWQVAFVAAVFAGMTWAYRAGAAAQTPPVRHDFQPQAEPEPVRVR